MGNNSERVRQLAHDAERLADRAAEKAQYADSDDDYGAVAAMAAIAQAYATAALALAVSNPSDTGG
jgi:hypothetical protein